MATLREYFDTDLSNTIKIYCRHKVCSEIDLLDFSANMACSSCYVPGDRPLDYFIQLVRSLQHGQTALTWETGSCCLRLAQFLEKLEF